MSFAPAIGVKPAESPPYLRASLAKCAYWRREAGGCNSNFDVALDLLTLCRIVLLRKNSGLDLLTEARAEERFPGLRTNLPALYAGYYIAELLGDGTQEHDPHPALFDMGLGTLRNLQKTGSEVTARNHAV